MISDMKKFLLNLRVTSNSRLSDSYALIRLASPEGHLPVSLPGQFVQVEIPDCKSAFLRRPISICDSNFEQGTLDLLVRAAGEGTKSLINIEPGKSLSVLMPLGHGFSTETVNSKSRVLLVGGGVGVAPLMMLGKYISNMGCTPDFLIGARSKNQILLQEEFNKIGNVHVSTDDGTFGTPGVVTQNPIITSGEFDIIYCCGPMPMMKAVAEIARKRKISCEVSLENHMACGMGACLCCVEQNNEGHNVCVCTEGPVFNIDRLSW